MADRVLGQLSLADGLAASDETIRTLLGHLSGPGSGNTSYPAEPLVRCLLLGMWHGLSDPAIEAQIRDRLSFRRLPVSAFRIARPTIRHCGASARS
nr:transposase [Mesorhizobium temperatum]